MQRTPDPLVTDFQTVRTTGPLLLTTEHRCDRCGAQAYVHAIIDETVQDLYFCGHHWNHHELALIPYLMYVNDERRVLTQAVQDDGHYPGQITPTKGK